MTDNNKRIQKYVNDLNWVNNCLHDFASRVAFIDISEQYMKKYALIKDYPFIMSIYNSMANDAVLRINNIYDKKKEVLSFYYLMRWIEKNEIFVKSYMHSLNLDFSNKEIKKIRDNVDKYQKLIEKFRFMRHKLIGHSNREFIDVIDIRRNLLNNKDVTSENVTQASAEYLENISKFLLQTEDFKEIKDKTISAILALKDLLKMPDRIFGRSGNLNEWEKFYHDREKEASLFYESMLKSINSVDS